MTKICRHRYIARVIYGGKDRGTYLTCIYCGRKLHQTYSAYRKSSRPPLSLG